MPRVLTRCSERGLAVPTGMWLKPAQLDTLAGEHAFRCQMCGEIHRWTQATAWVEGAPARAPAAAP